jgi:signal peptidase I
VSLVKRGSLLELVLLVACAVGLAFAVQAWAVKPYQIPSASMEPTLDIGQRVLVNRLGTHFGDPDVGDIIVFHPPAGADRESAHCGVRPVPERACPVAPDEESDTNFIKRVVATGGETLRIVDGHPIVDGQRLDESYAVPCNGGKCDLPKQITIPPDHFFVMGDNRPSSYDSRYWGSVPKAWIVGKAFATYWPPDRIGLF